MPYVNAKRHSLSVVVMLAVRFTVDEPITGCDFAALGVALPKLSALVT